MKSFVNPSLTYWGKKKTHASVSNLVYDQLKENGLTARRKKWGRLPFNDAKEKLSAVPKYRSTSSTRRLN